MDDFNEGALNDGADASPADGMEIADWYASPEDSEEVAALSEDDDIDQALNEDADEDEARGPVPYERFHQVNERYQELNRWSPILEALRAEGYDSPEAVQEALEQRALEAEQTQVAAAYQQQVDQGLLDPQVASQRLRAELEHRALQREREQLAGWMREQDLAAVSRRYPEADTDYVRAMAAATGRPVADLARESHEQRTAYRERVIADYHNQKEGDRRRGAPEGGGGKNAPRRGGVPEINSPDFDKWYEQELRKTLQTYR
ncbi:hypothetical protein CCAX7_55260 [Capsulimonas corticalis]|uniref:Uncharacterized protein n=1 Tax=Capsulimonas corticalis TaxID=2219043 RepID=A0A402D5K1_9BACT|nr:hypothetical protein [Capsulimonas corticalis]BDI33475.1 hypothetical protein CCAX7_55260 [Capsulimonas corticalis]